MRHLMAAMAVVGALVPAAATAQKLASFDKARPVAGDPGIFFSSVLERPDFRIWRDYAEPGATRRMHAHDDVTYHVFVLVTGQLRLTVEGEAPVDVTPGEAISIKARAMHGFVNTGTVDATIVEVFGKAARPADVVAAPDAAALAALAQALAASRPGGDR